jgi:hypothetical protein
MKSTIVLASILTTLIAVPAESADSAAADPLTKLPLPTASSPIHLDTNPSNYGDVPVCKSRGTMNFYTPLGGSVAAAVAWYTAHLSGFKHVHGYGSGRSQDTFYNASGTLTVSITGEPGKEGQDTNLYSIIYSTIQPGVPDKVIAGMNIQKVDCP